MREVAFPIGAAATLEQLAHDPHPLLARLRAREPVSWVPALGAWLVTRRDLALAAMRDAETFTVDDPRFSSGRVVGRSMLTTDGAEHDRHRDPFARSFRLDAVRERFTAVVAAETGRLIDAIEPSGAAELRRELAGPLAATVVLHALGLEHADAAEVLGWYEEIVGAVTRVTAGGPVGEAGSVAFAALSASIAPHVDALVPERGSLTREEAISNAAVLMFGGIETTEGMIANALLHLLSNREQLTLVEADRDLLANAIEESLRLEPSAAVIDRYATRDTELGGAEIGERELVTLSLAAVNRDPAVFPDPDRFDVRRENARLHLAFAQGPQPSAARGLVFRKPPELWVVWSPPRTS